MQALLVAIVLIGLTVYSWYKIGFMEDWKTVYERHDGTVEVEYDSSWREHVALWTFFLSLAILTYTKGWMNFGWWSASGLAFLAFFSVAVHPPIMRYFAKMVIACMAGGVIAGIISIILFFTKPATHDKTAEQPVVEQQK